MSRMTNPQLMDEIVAALATADELCDEARKRYRNLELDLTQFQLSQIQEAQVYIGLARASIDFVK